MGDAGGELAERSELFRLHEAILRFAKVGEGLFEFARARLHLLEQARILDGDDGLIGEGAQDFDVARREGAGFRARHDNGAEHFRLAHQGNAEQRAGGRAAGGEGDRVIRLGEHVYDFFGLPGQNGSARHGPTVGRRKRMRLQILLQRRRSLRPRYPPIAENLAVAHAKRAGGRAAEIDGGGDEGLEDRVEIEGRAADDFEHVGGGGLLGERFFEIARARLHLVEQPRVLDGDDGLIGEGLQDRQFVGAERLQDVAKHDHGADGAVVLTQRRAADRARAPGAGVRQAREIGHRGIKVVEIGNVNLPRLRHHRAREIAAADLDHGARVGHADPLGNRAGAELAHELPAFGELDRNARRREQARAGLGDEL